MITLQQWAIARKTVRNIKKASDGQAHIVKTFETKQLPNIYRHWNVEEQIQTDTPRTGARALIHICARK